MDKTFRLSMSKSWARRRPIFLTSSPVPGQLILAGLDDFTRYTATIILFAIVESYSYCLCASVGMASPEIHHLFHAPIADHSFSEDRQSLAVARDNIIELYRRVGSKLELQDDLRGHDKLVTGVDIAPRSGKIVTCSQGSS